MNNLLKEKILCQLEEHSKEPTLFWGASNFLKNFISSSDMKKYNILGIIDNDSKKWNTSFCGYNIFSPNKLSNIKTVNIIDTVLNDYSANYARIKKIINTKYKSSNINILANAIYSDFENYVQSMKKSKVSKNCEYFISTPKEIEHFTNLEYEYNEYSEMNDLDRLFLVSLIQRTKPKKILELGVSKGGSSYLILNTIKNFKNNKLYSIDYNTDHYYLKDKKTGFFLDNYPDLKKNWILKTGGLALNFLDEISSSTNEKEKFDFCFIDTMHTLPGEILDFLQILPYMKRNSIIVFHDTNWQINDSRCFVNNMLMSSIQGKKILPYPKPYFNTYFSTIGSKFFFNNIGAININKNTFSSLYEIFNLLTIPWDYMPNQDDLNKLISFFKKYYSEYYSAYFKEVALMQEQIRHK